MATAYLLQSTSAPLKWKHTFPSRQLPPFPPNFLFESSKLSGKLISKPTIPNPRLIIRSRSRDEEITSPNSIEVMVDMIKKVLNLLKKPAIAAILLGILLMWYPSSALAASGGRMGGSDFSSGSSSSSYSSSSCCFSDHSYDSSPEDEECFSPILCVLPWIVIVVCLFCECCTCTSVLKLQVGVSGTAARSLQRELNWIAETADTSRSSGFRIVLKETIQALLWKSDFCISGYSSTNVKFISIKDAEKLFNQLSIEERGKFDEETLVNVNNVKRKGTETQNTATGVRNEYIVITILVAAQGLHRLPSIKKSKDLKVALQKLSAFTTIESELVEAVEVLWTPQKDNDTLSEQELREDYPLLRPFQKL